MSSVSTFDHVRPYVVPAPAKLNPPALGRLEFVEGMRALCALYVVLGHVANLVDPSFEVGTQSHEPKWMQALLAPFHYGHLAVVAFIVISGFCLRWASAQRNDADASNFKSFLLRRVKRILPPYYACLIMSVAIAIWITPIPHAAPFSIYLPVTLPNLAAHLFLVQNLSPAWMYKINGVLWSIAIEFQIYFLFRYLAVGLKKLGTVFTLGSTLVFAFFVVTYFPNGVKLYPWFLSFFLLGMIAADIARLRKGRIHTFSLLAYASAALVILGFAENWGPIAIETFVACFSASMLALGARRGRKSVLVRTLAWRPLAIIGTFSFSLYLIHDPLLQTLSIYHPQWVQNSTQNLMYLVFIGVPAAIFFSFLFALVFEGKYVRKALAAATKSRKQIVQPN